MRRSGNRTEECGVDATTWGYAGRIRSAVVLGSSLALLALPALACGGEGGAEPAGPSEEPAAMAKSAGDGQEGPPGTLLPAPLEVTVRGDSGDPVAGVDVRFTSSAGRIVPSLGRTDEDGHRSVRLQLPDRVGPVAVTASADGLPDVEFTAEALSMKPNPYEFPVAVSGRFIVDADGRPVVLNGATPWSLAVQLDSSEVERYLDARVEQGVNAVLFNAIEHLYADAPPANAFGELPFTETLAGGEEDMTALNPAYWDFVEWIVAEARERGIVCLVVPSYVGFQFNDAGWSAEMLANGTARLRAYGDSLARRLAAGGNVIWVMGGDWRTTFDGTDLSAEVNALARGLEEAAPGAILTAHPDPENSALGAYDEPWLDLNTSYSRPPDTPDRLRTDWAATDGDGEAPMPSIFVEGVYENEHGSAPSVLRSQMYWSLLGGAAGHFYGIHPVWPFEAPSAASFGDSSAPPYDTWQNALRTDVAGDLVHVRRLVDSRPVRLLVPDWEEVVVTAGRGSGSAYAAASRASDGSLVLAYVPERREITVDMSSITTDSVATASWWDPRTGDTTGIGEFDTDADRGFTPPAEGDWLLVVEDAPH